MNAKIEKEINPVIKIDDPFGFYKDKLKANKRYNEFL